MYYHTVGLESMILAANWDNWVVFGYLLGDMNDWVVARCSVFRRDHLGH